MVPNGSAAVIYRCFIVVHLIPDSPFTPSKNGGTAIPTVGQSISRHHLFTACQADSFPPSANGSIIHPLFCR